MDVSVSVRRATADDADDLGRVHGDAWLAAYGGLFAADFLEQAAERRRRAWPGHFADLSSLGRCCSSRSSPTAGRVVPWPS